MRRLTTLMIAILGVLMVGILLWLSISYMRYETAGPKKVPKESKVKAPEITPRLAEIHTLLEQKTEEIRQEKQALQKKAQQNLRYLQKLCKDPKIIAFTETGTILYVHPNYQIWLCWNSYEERPVVDGSGFGLGKPAVEDLWLESLRCLAELNQEMILNTINEQVE